MSRPIKVGITHGDFNGVGYEVILGALANEDILDLCTPVVFGFHAMAEKCRRQLGLEDMKLHRAESAFNAHPGRITVIDVDKNMPELTPGRPSPESGKAAVAALRAAVEALKKGSIDVLVTAPHLQGGCAVGFIPFPRPHGVSGGRDRRWGEGTHDPFRQQHQGSPCQHPSAHIESG